MATIAVLVLSSLVTVIAVIGLADAVTHLLCGAARALKAPRAVAARHPSATSATPPGLAS